jgi:enoyl-CoA hydratase/carnithine racemase
VILAEEALALGLVNRVVAPESLLDTAVAYARELATHSSPASMAVMKRQVYHHHELDLAAAMRDTNQLMNESLTRPDFREGVASFVEKRPPRFAPLGK